MVGVYYLCEGVILAKKAIMENIDIRSVKQRFEIVGNSTGLDRAIEKAVQVAPTDLTVLVTGESGVGKEVFPRIVHAFSARKHAPYIAVNCGAIPEGTIDSELFGHEKGSFTGALSERKGYFEVSDGGTIFLDEVGELPLSTQAKLLRVLEAGEFMRVGSSKVQKTNVRVIAATNVDLPKAVEQGKFREDLFYRISTIPIAVPALRDRREDVPLLFRKFASDVAEKYRMPAVRLTNDAVELLKNYSWPGNVRQLKNVAEQVSFLARDREVDAGQLREYMPTGGRSLPTLTGSGDTGGSFANEREILYKILFDMKRDMNDLKRVVYGILERGGGKGEVKGESLVKWNDYGGGEHGVLRGEMSPEEMVSGEVIDGEMATSEKAPEAEVMPRVVVSGAAGKGHAHGSRKIEDAEPVEEESLSLEEKEREMIVKALERNHGRRKGAAVDLGISERTLYRKLKEYRLDG